MAFPVRPFTEKNGTFVNATGASKGSSWPWNPDNSRYRGGFPLVVLLASAMGEGFDFEDTSSIFNAMAGKRKP